MVVVAGMLLSLSGLWRRSQLEATLGVGGKVVDSDTLLFVTESHNIT